MRLSPLITLIALAIAFTVGGILYTTTHKQIDQTAEAQKYKILKDSGMLDKLHPNRTAKPNGQ